MMRPGWLVLLCVLAPACGGGGGDDGGTVQMMVRCAPATCGIAGDLTAEISLQGEPQTFGSSSPVPVTLQAGMTYQVDVTGVPPGDEWGAFAFVDADGDGAISGGDAISANGIRTVVVAEDGVTVAVPDFTLDFVAM